METRWMYTTSENFPALREASVKFLKEDENLIKWHNQNWNTNI